MSGLFDSRSSTVTKDPQLTPEQQKAMADLLGLGESGTLGTPGTAGYLQLGDPYTGSLGDFNQTATQQTAGNQLQSLLDSATPTGYTTAENTLTGLAKNTFDPNDPTSGWQAYQNQANRAFQTSNDVLNREAAITGDRFSTSLGQNKANLAAQNNDTLATQLASLYNSAQDRSLNAANSLGNLETQIGNNSRSNIAAGFDPSQGGIQNTLNNAQAQAQLAEFNRQRNEKLSQVTDLNSVLNKNVQYSNLSTTTEAPSIFSSIYGQINPLVGSYNTAKYGAANAPNQANLGQIAQLASAALKAGG